jgi:hypothetical protein
MGFSLPWSVSMRKARRCGGLENRYPSLGGSRVQSLPLRLGCKPHGYAVYRHRAWSNEAMILAKRDDVSDLTGAKLANGCSGYLDRPKRAPDGESLHLVHEARGPRNGADLYPRCAASSKRRRPCSCGTRSAWDASCCDGSDSGLPRMPTTTSSTWGGRRASSPRTPHLALAPAHTHPGVAEGNRSSGPAKEAAPPPGRTCWSPGFSR